MPQNEAEDCSDYQFLEDKDDFESNQILENGQGGFLVERNKKLENPLYNGKQSKKAADDGNNQYLAKIPGQAGTKQGLSP